MGIVIVVLRALHILGGIFWAGGTWMLYGFIVPSVEATRPESNRFMQHLAGHSGLPVVSNLAGFASVVAGLALFGPVSGHFDRDWMRSPHGIVLSIGAAVALLAFLESQFVMSPAGRKLGAIGRAIAASGGSATAEQAQQAQALQRKLLGAGRRGMVLLAIAALLMSIARYV